MRAEVRQHQDHFELVKKYPPANIWREVTSAKEIEQTILNRNHRHLLQASIEEGRVHDPLMQQMIDNYGTNDMIEALRRGELTIPEATDEAIQAWISALNQTGGKITNLPPVIGEFTTDNLQSAFKAVDEKTTSSPSGVQYSIWKTLARQTGIAK